MSSSTLTVVDLQARVADLEQQLAAVAHERDKALARLADFEQSDEEFLQRIDEARRNPLSAEQFLERLKRMEFEESPLHERLAG